MWEMQLGLVIMIFLNRDRGKATAPAVTGGVATPIAGVITPGGTTVAGTAVAAEVTVAAGTAVDMAAAPAVPGAAEIPSPMKDLRLTGPPSIVQMNTVEGAIQLPTVLAAKGVETPTLLVATATALAKAAGTTGTGVGINASIIKGLGLTAQAAYTAHKAHPTVGGEKHLSSAPVAT